MAEKIVKSIADTGANMIIAGGSVSELILHYVEKYRMMIVKVQSKFELKRLCKVYSNVYLYRLLVLLLWPDWVLHYQMNLVLVIEFMFRRLAVRK